MTQWHSKELRKGESTAAYTNRIEAAFTPLFAARTPSQNILVLRQRDVERGVDVVFFSPDASGLAKMFGAVPCEKPARNPHLRLLFGEHSALELIYHVD